MQNGSIFIAAAKVGFETVGNCSVPANLSFMKTHQDTEIQGSSIRATGERLGLALLSCAHQLKKKQNRKQDNKTQVSKKGK